MRKILLPLCIVIAIAACNQTPEGYTIKGSLEGEVANGTKAYLRKQGLEKQPVEVDTATVTDGKFVFTGNSVTVPEMHYIFVDGLQDYVGLVLENGTMEMNAHKDSLGFARTKGTVQNDIFTDYMDKSREISKKAQSVQNDMREASQRNDSVAMNSLRDEMGELQEEYKNFDLGYIKDNPNGLISALLLQRALASRMVDIDEVQGMYDALSPEIKETEAAKSVFENLEASKEREAKSKNTSIGAKAPNFSAPTPSGEELALNDALGKVTLVDFWAAWCKPCRLENPNVVKVYKKYHDKGLNIIGVSLDKKAEDWKKAIADDGLDWNHVSNLAYFEDEIAKLYNVEAIPAAFLLDANGKIIAKNLRGPALEEKVAELLN